MSDAYNVVGSHSSEIGFLSMYSICLPVCVRSLLSYLLREGMEMLSIHLPHPITMVL